MSYVDPSLKGGYIQCTETLFLIGSYPSGNYFPWWDHHFSDLLWCPNLILFLFISRPEKNFMISKNIVLDWPFCFSKFFNVTDAEVRIKRPITWIFILSKRKDITDKSHHYWIFKNILTCVPWVKIISTMGVRLRFWCWSRFSMLKKSPWTCLSYCKIL